MPTENIKGRIQCIAIGSAKKDGGTVFSGQESPYPTTLPILAQSNAFEPFKRTQR